MKPKKGKQKEETIKVFREIEDMDFATMFRKDILEYGKYIMSHRAIPRTTDGFLTGEGRVIYGMQDMNNTADGPFKKSAKAVGHILGSFHPHGDTALYGTMIKLSQKWKTYVPLVDIHGSNGNITGDGAAAMRYCVTGDTIIKSNKGNLPIAELYERYKETVSEDGTVTTEDLECKSMNGVWNKASKIFNCGEHPIKKITLRNGLELKGTYNHPVMTMSRDVDLKWKTLEELNVGDFVLIDFNDNNDDVLVQTPSKFNLNKSNMFYCKHRAIEVMSIENLPEEVVYSPKIESECHSFISNGIVSHNTEARLSRYAKFLTEDLKYNTVEMVDNYDGTTKEPAELPSRIPLLLINGARGIVTGFSSSFLSHNPGDAMRVCIEYNLNRKMTIEEMIDILKAPDFPTGGIINGLESVTAAYMTGKGSCRVKGLVEHKEDSKGNPIIDIVALPPDANHDSFKESVYQLSQTGQIKLREKVMDLTAEEGVRIRLVLKKEEDPKRIENLLYKKTTLESSCKMGHFALVDGLPKDVTLEDIVKEFIHFRERVVYKRSIHKLEKCESDLEIQKGLRIAYDNLDEIIDLIRKSDTAKKAQEVLIKKYKLTERQAAYILDMKLRSLTSLESDIVEKKIKDLEKEIDILKKITTTKSNKHITKIIDEELNEVLDAFKKDGLDKRVCKIIEKKKDVSIMDAIKDEYRTLVYTSKGRLKNMDVAPNVQHRTGVGSSLFTAEDDEVEIILPTSTTSNVLIFTNLGKVYGIQPYKIDVTSKAARGSLAKTILGLADNERIIYMQSVPKDHCDKDKSLVFVTKNGMIKRTDYAEYTMINSNGKRAIKLQHKDTLVSVHMYDDKDPRDLLISTYEGYSIRIGTSSLSHVGRDATGVIGIKLKNKQDKVIAATILNTDSVFMINEDGMIKRVAESEFNKQTRGGYGVLSGSKLVSVIGNNPKVHVISIYSRQGMNINIEKSSIRKVSRTSTGVKSMRLTKEDKILKMFEL